MAQRKVEQTAAIAVVATDGSQHTVDEYTTYTLHEPSSGPSRWLRGSRHFELDGEHCNAVDEGTFEVAVTGQILRRV